MATPANNDEIIGSAPFYVRPEALNPEKHGKLGVHQRDTPFAFAAKHHFVPLLAAEFPVAATTYPIIFAGEERTPLAVMGINQGENLYFDETGFLRNDIYMPAYVRRYPFTVANDDANQRAIVCIDAGADIVGENAAFPFFENGEASDYTKRCIEYCQNYESDRLNTQTFIKRLIDLDLFELREAKYQPQDATGAPVGEPQVLAGYFAIADTRVQKLSAEVLVQLRDEGVLPLIYAHQISLWLWERLIAMAITRQNAEAAKAAKA